MGKGAGGKTAGFNAFDGNANTNAYANGGKAKGNGKLGVGCGNKGGTPAAATLGGNKSVFNKFNFGGCNIGPGGKNSGSFGKGSGKKGVF